MSTTHPCAICGSESATSDYCDTCGAPLEALAAPETAPAPIPPSPTSASTSAPADPSGIQPAVSSAAAPGANTSTCYFCGAPRGTDDVYCEVCGLDFVSGQMPAPRDPTPPAGMDLVSDAPTDAPSGQGPTDVPSGAPTDVPSGTPSGAPSGTPSGQVTRVASAAPWRAVVAADRAFFDGNVTAGVVTFPEPVVPREVALSGAEVSIGRRSESQGFFPDIDLSTPVDDPAVSRRHAVLQRQADGSWAVLDASSTNGTWLNDEVEPLAHGLLRPLRDGDRLLLGAFTCITIRQEQPAAG